jgi:hypothetical protein
MVFELWARLGCNALIGGFADGPHPPSNRRVIAAVAYLLAGVGTGCDLSRDWDEAKFFARLESSHAGRSFASQLHIFPATVARGQTVHHRFALKNPTGRTIRLRSADASTPCCSSIRLEARALAARESTTAEVEWRIARGTGRKAVDFTIETDSADYPELKLRLVVDLRADWEVIPARDGLPKFRMGEGGEVRMRILSRRTPDEGAGSLVAVDSDPPLHARFAGSASPPVLVAEGVREESREIVAILAPSNDVGVHRGTVRFGWSDGRQEAIDVAWEVVPHVRASPSALFVTRGIPTTRVIMIRSEGDPIRILGVTGPLQEDPLANPGVVDDVHELVLKILVPTDGTDPAPNVRNTTDSRRQPVVEVVLIAAPAGGKEVDR